MKVLQFYEIPCPGPNVYIPHKVMNCFPFVHTITYEYYVMNHGREDAT